MKTERARNTGSVVVELAMTLPFFLLFMYGVLECARLMYLWNTLQDSARVAARAAAIADFSDPAAQAALRKRALFRDTAGALPLGEPIDGSYLRIEYLWQDAAGALSPIPAASMPASPAQNLFNCTQDPNSAGCIRFVRASICQPAQQDRCAPVPVQPLLPLAPLDWAGLALPTSTSLARAEALGYRAGAPLP
ncbi:pilus assembly protein [Pseudoduganella sp. LjRoot289]|uniref:TadE family protein n=1 Tax=Pseudoduganella sp. LjRoot289 TaxID=3342314 RepID=UPI003ECDD0BB